MHKKDQLRLLLSRRIFFKQQKTALFIANKTVDYSLSLKENPYRTVIFFVMVEDPEVRLTR